jgi:uncharacterized protein
MNTARTLFGRFGGGFAALGLALAMLATSARPALARDTYVMDGAGLLASDTVTALNQQIGDFNRQTGKEVVVDTVPSLGGQTIQQAAEDAFAKLQVNGVLIFMAKAERADLVVGDRASSAFFPPGSFASIHDAMRGYFRSGDFDGGIKTAVNLILNQYRSHMRSYGGTRGVPVPQNLQPVAVQQSTGGFHMGFFWLLIILLAGFMIIRALFRAMSGPRMMPPGYGQGGPGMGPMGYGGGYGGGGGNFFSGLLGGLGGAWLGSELFGNRGGQMIGGDPNIAGVGGGMAGGADSAGWQSDAGQADMGNAGGGDWGGGGGFDSGGGGGDFGGGGGGDSGGGW